MPLLETAALGLAGVLAKEVAKALLGKDTALLDAASVLIDVVKGHGERSLSDARDARKIESLSRDIAARTLKTFEREGNGFDDEDKRRIKAEVAATIASTPLTPQFIIERNYDDALIARDVLAQAAPRVAQAQLSAPEQAAYERMVSECTRAMSDVIASVDGFMPLMLGEAMSRQRDFEDVMLNALMQRMAQARDEGWAQTARAFEQQYRALARDRFDRFELFGIRDVQDQVGTRRSLSEAYVSLSVQGEARGERSLERQTVEQAVSLSPRLVVTGLAGGGKSTLVKYLTVKAATEGLPAELSALRGVTPFVLRLRHYPDQAFPNVEDWLRVEFSQLPNPPDSWIRRLLEAGQALVLVDGVDEMPEAKREAMLDALRQLVQLYPAARYVITSRPAALQDWPAWREWVDEAGFTRVSMDPMFDEQRSALVTRWFNEYGKAERDPERLRRLVGIDDRLNGLIEDRPALKSLASNPLMCAMVCAVYEIHGDSLPHRRTELYDKCIDMALSRRDDERGVKAAGDYKTIVEKRPLLQHVAAWMMPMTEASTSEHDEAEVRASVDKSRLIAHMDTWIGERKLPGADGAAMCRFYVERASLLRELLVGVIEFEHRTFQEYLAAQEMCEQDRLEDLEPRLGDGAWREVIVLVAGSANRRQRELLFKLVRESSLLRLRQKVALLLDCMAVASSRMTQSEHVSTLCALPGLPKLATLDLSYMTVSDVSALAGLTNLTTLMLSGPTVSDVSALAGLTNLTMLMLSGPTVSDMSALAGLTNLTTLRLSGPTVSDVSALAGLTKLATLDVRADGIADLRSLAALPALKRLAVTAPQWTDANESEFRRALPNLRVFVTLDGQDYLPEMDED